MKCDICKFNKICDQHYWDCRYNPVSDAKKNVQKASRKKTTQKKWLQTENGQEYKRESRKNYRRSKKKEHEPNCRCSMCLHRQYNPNCNCLHCKAYYEKFGEINLC